MKSLRSTWLLTSVVVLSFGLLLGGCASKRAYREGQKMVSAKDWDQAVYHLSKALSLDPTNIEYRTALDVAKVKASQFHLELAKSYVEAGSLDLSIIEYRVAAMLDPTNRYVADSLENALDQKREILEAQAAEPSSIESLKEQTRVEAGSPVLSPSSSAPITLNFPPQSKVKEIYQAICKAAGINVLFDNGIRDQETFSIDIANVSFKKALDLIAIGNKHFYKAIDASTIMIIPDNPQKRRDYEDHVVKTFYLSNAVPNDVVNTLRGLLDARRVAVNTQLNAITIRDTPAKIAVMERIIEANDKPPSEVVIDVEILEVRNTDEFFYGAGLSSYQVTQTLEQPDTVNSLQGLRFSSLPFINASDWLLTLPNINYRLEKNRSNIRTLARPSLRALDGKQVTLRLGDQVPIETSTFSAIAGAATPLTRQFQFRDIGTNVDITPRVHHNSEVTLQLQVEVTSVGADPDGPAGPTPPTFGNRRITTEIRLKDGETNLLAGLFTSSEERSRGGMPIISDLPIIGSIFGSNSRTRRETDIVLTLTPHIVRTPNIRKRDLEPFYVGTATNVGGLTAVSDISPLGGSPFSGDDGDERAVPVPSEPPPGSTPPAGVAPRPGATPPVPTAPTRRQLPGIKPPDQQGSFDPEPGQPSPTRGTPPVDSGSTAGVEAVAGVPAPTPTPTPQQPAVVTLSPAASIVAIGDSARIDVVVDGVVGLGHAPMYVNFDPSVLAAVSVSEGSFLRSDGGTTQFITNIQPTGRIIVGLARVGRQPGVSGSGTLFSITFRAVSSGSSPVTFSQASLRNAAAGAVPATFIPGAITVP